MLPHLVNIVAGFILGAPKLKELGAKDFFEKLENFLKPYRTWIGWVALIVGLITLLDRIDIISLFDMFDGDSYPQAIPLILIGLILLAGHFEKYEWLHNFIQKIEPYKVWIGLWGMLAGLISIFFGCPVC